MNPYIIILSFFIIGSLAATIWGWMIMANGRKTLAWPHVPGIVEESTPTSSVDDLLPHILFSYIVDKQAYRHTMNFPKGLTPTPEYTASYMKRFPVGANVDVYYDPQDINRATLEPGLARGDWLVFLLGLCSTLLGVVFLFSGN